jgi:hypothetical protein
LLQTYLIGNAGFPAAGIKRIGRDINDAHHLWRAQVYQFTTRIYGYFFLKKCIFSHCLG